MKKIMLLMAALTVSGSLFAQDGDKTGMEWIEEFEGKEKVIINPNYGGPGTRAASDMFYLMPLDEQLSVLYGSRYRKAQARRIGGVSPALGLSSGLASFAFATALADLPGVAVLTGLGAAACLATGIPLWVKGRREMDALLDDYSQNYAPRPYSSSLSFGPTSSGVGLALKF